MSGIYIVYSVEPPSISPILNLDSDELDENSGGGSVSRSKQDNCALATTFDTARRRETMTMKKKDKNNSCSEKS